MRQRPRRVRQQLACSSSAHSSLRSPDDETIHRPHSGTRCSGMPMRSVSMTLTASSLANAARPSGQIRRTLLGRTLHPPRLASGGSGHRCSLRGGASCSSLGRLGVSGLQLGDIHVAYPGFGSDDIVSQRSSGTRQIRRLPSRPRDFRRRRGHREPLLAPASPDTGSSIGQCPAPAASALDGSTGRCRDPGGGLVECCGEHGSPSPQLLLARWRFGRLFRSEISVAGNFGTVVRSSVSAGQGGHRRHGRLRCGLLCTSVAATAEARTGSGRQRHQRPCQRHQLCRPDAWRRQDDGKTRVPARVPACSDVIGPAAQRLAWRRRSTAAASWAAWALVRRARR